MSSRRQSTSREAIRDTDDDDVVEIIAGIPKENISCQICSYDLGPLTKEERNSHYNNHFDNEREQPVAIYDLTNDDISPMKSKKTGSNGPKRRKSDVFWHASQQTRPPQNYTPGLIPIIKKALNESHHKGFTDRAVLCYENMVHVSTSFDLGWGCGYRNFLMSCTALYDQEIQPDYFPLLDSPLPPSVSHLQKWVEDAWSAGFDKEGAQQLSNKLVNTTKWIGTAEIYVALAHRGVPASLVDFHSVQTDVEPLIRWVERYFTSPYPPGQDPPASNNGQQLSITEALRGASPVVSTNRMPLILQNKGHSRTIIGIEKHKNRTNLLIMDPSRRPSETIRSAALRIWNPRLFEGTSEKNHTFSPAKLARKIIHTPETLSNKLSSARKRRNSQPSDSESSKLKRVRGGLHDLEHDVIILHDSDDDTAAKSISARLSSSNNNAQNKSSELTHVKVLNFFRVTTEELKKHRQYQILYFPLEPPLSEAEKLARHVVMSETVKKSSSYS